MRSIEKRFKEHLKDKSKTHRGCWIRSVINKGGIPRIELIDVAGNDWKFWEQHYISLFRSWGFKLVNLSQGGESSYGVRRTKEQKELLSEIRKQYYWDNPEKKSLLNSSLTKEQRKRGIEKLKGRKIAFKPRKKGRKLSYMPIMVELLKKPVRLTNINTGEIYSFESVCECARVLKLSQSTISYAIKRKSTVQKIYKIKYAA